MKARYRKSRDRVVEIDGRFYPQHRSWFFGWQFYDGLVDDQIDGATWWTRESYDTLQAAIDSLKVPAQTVVWEQ